MKQDEEKVENSHLEERESKWTTALETVETCACL